MNRRYGKRTKLLSVFSSLFGIVLLLCVQALVIKYMDERAVIPITAGIMVLFMAIVLFVAFRLFSKVNENAAAAQQLESVRAIHEILSSGYWNVEFDKNGKIKSCVYSDKYRKMIHATKEQFADNFDSWTSIIVPEDRGWVAREFWDMMRDLSEDRLFNAEYRLIDCDGNQKWFHSAGKLIR